MALALVGCEADDSHDHLEQVTGEQLYQHHCAACHRDAGQGAFLKGVPPLKYSSMTAQEIAGHILGHGRGADSRMPRFANMPAQEAGKIASFLRRKLQVHPGNEP